MKNLPIKCMLIWSFNLSTEASFRPHRIQQKSSPAASSRLPELWATDTPRGDVAAAEAGDL